MKEIYNRFESAAKIVLYVFAAALPLWFLPRPVGIDFSREVLFGILILAAGILWLLSVLTQGEFRFQNSLVLYAAAGFLLVMGLATLFSQSPVVSALYADPAAEKFITVVYAVVLLVLSGSIFRSRADVGMLTLILLSAGALAGVFTLIQLLTGWVPYRLLASFAQGIDFNVVGTINGLMLFYGTLLTLTVGMLFTGTRFAPWIKWLHYGYAAIFLLNLLVVNFRTSWIVLLGAGIFLFGLAFKNVRKTLTAADSSQAAADSPQLSASDQRLPAVHFYTPQLLAIGVIIISVVMIMIRTPLIPLNLPAEISPSFSSTWNVATSVFKEGVKPMLLGSGPGTFGLDWSRYKDLTINQTIFWNVRFNQGFSWVSTLLATTGILGLLSFAILLLTAFGLFLKRMLTSPDGDSGLTIGLFGGFVFLLISSALYPANLTMALLLFLVAGVLMGVLAKKSASDVMASEANQSQEGMATSPLDALGAPRNDEMRWGWRWCLCEITEKTVRFENPWTVFLSSLAVIFFLSLGLVGIYREVGRMSAAFAQASGVESLNRGDIDTAISHFSRAVAVESRNYRNHQNLAQVRTQKIRQIIQRAAAGENVQQEFQGTVAVAIQNAQQAVQLYPSEPFVWRTQGALYELLIPFITGSERFAFDSYRRASDLDPLNPAVWTDLGRAGLTYADRILAVQGQANPQERQSLEELRVKTLQDVEQALNKAVEVKADFAQAHFLLSQTAIRLGNLQSAIRSTENAKITAPFDIGVAFQLGLLYYQANDLTRAEAELLRAVSLNPNYSNARYFLGLIYDRKDDKKAAIAQFEEIQKFNPDNQEVASILENLREGRGALEGIVPPAQPPEARREPPVTQKEREESK